jgi:hypothetical protein
VLQNIGDGAQKIIACFNKRKRPEEKLKPSNTEGKLKKQKRQRINRWSWRIARWLLFLAVVVSVYFLGKTNPGPCLEKTVYTNQMFTVRAVDVRVFGGVSKEVVVLEFLDVKIGKII